MEKLQIVKESSVNDLREIARCHISAFPKSLSSKLGLPYCTKMLEWYLTSENKFLFHIEEDRIVAGYCGGFVRKGESFGSSTGMTQHASKIGIISILLRPWLLAHPNLRRNYKFLWRNLKLFIKRKSKPSIVVHHTIKRVKLTAGLVVIGVDPKYQGRGYGYSLLKEFEKRALEMDCTNLNLTVEADNGNAIRAYERNGWKKGDEKDGHINMFKLIKE